MRTRNALALGVALGAAAALSGPKLAAALPELMDTRIVKASDLRVVPGPEGPTRMYFDAPTSTLLNLGLRAVTLEPGATPHPSRPHSRPTEGVLLVHEGTLEIRLDEQGESAERLEPGSAVFLSSNQWHALRNPGSAPVTYYELAWTSPGMNGEPDYPEEAVNWRRRPR